MAAVVQLEVRKSRMMIKHFCGKCGSISIASEKKTDSPRIYTAVLLYVVVRVYCMCAESVEIRALWGKGCSN